MQGRILSSGNNQGIILGDDGIRYSFTPFGWQDQYASPEVGMRVDFEPRGSHAVGIHRIVGASPTPPAFPEVPPTQEVSTPRPPSGTAVSTAQRQSTLRGMRRTVMSSPLWAVITGSALVALIIAVMTALVFLAISGGRVDWSDSPQEIVRKETVVVNRMLPVEVTRVVVVESEVEVPVAVPVDVTRVVVVENKVEVPVDVTRVVVVENEVEVPVEVTRVVVVENEVEVPVEVLVPVEVTRVVETEADIPVRSLAPEHRIAALVPEPRTIVFQQIGQSERLEIVGLFTDGSEEPMPDSERAGISFDSTDRSIVDVSDDGVVTSVSPGSADVTLEYYGIQAEVPIIVYAPIVEIPPIDPTKILIFDENDENSGGAVLNRIIVYHVGDVYDPGLANQIASDHGGNIVAEFKNLGAFLLEFAIDTPEEMQAALELLEEDINVSSVMPNLLIPTNNQPSAPPTHHIETLNLGPVHRGAYTSIELEGAWEQIENMGPLVKPVHIAIIDTGLHLQHTDQDINQVLEHEFGGENSNRIIVNLEPKGDRQLGSNHGINVASAIIANNNSPTSPDDSAIGDFEGDFSGVVSSVTNIPYMLHFYQAGITIKFLWFTIAKDLIDQAAVLSAIDHISNHGENIDVLNMSFGGPLPTCEPANPCPDLDNGINVFGNMPNTIPIRSAGNETIPASETTVAGLHPSVIRESVLTIGALDGTDRAWFSNYGQDDITLAAEGNAVYSVDNNNVDGEIEVRIDDGTPNGEPRTLSFTTGYRIAQGTSLAAPLVSGVVALMRSVDSELSREEVRSILQDTARIIDVNTPDGTEQWKHVDANAAIQRILNDNIDADIVENEFRPAEGLSDDFIRFSFPVENTGDMTWRFFNEIQLTSPVQQGVSETRPIVVFEVLLAPGQRISVNGGFWADGAGDWTLTARVLMDDSGITVLDEMTSVIQVSSPTESIWRRSIAPPSTPSGILQADANILLVADTSGSMDGAKIVSLRRALSDFINKVDDAGEFVGLIDFDEYIREIIPLGQFATDQGSLQVAVEKWNDAINRLDSDGGTAFYDAVSHAVATLEAEGVSGRTNIIIALTDGFDEDSSLSLNGLIDEIQNSSVPVLLFAVGFGDDAEMGVLQQIAEATGGVALPANPDDLDRLYALLTTLF